MKTAEVAGANSAANVADSGADGQIRIQYLGYSPTTAAPPAFVRQTPLTANATAASHSATFSALPSAGNMVVVYVATWYSSAHDVPTANVTDNNGNSYLLACKRVQSFGADHFVAAIFYAPAIQVTGGTFQVTASASTSSEMLLRAIEYSGLSSANALDQSVDNSATSSSATSGTTGTTSATYELLAGVVNLDSGGGVSITPTGGFTSRGSTSGGTNPMAGFADRIVSSTGTYQATWTLGSSVGYSACLATFK